MNAALILSVALALAQFPAAATAKPAADRAPSSGLAVQSPSLESWSDRSLDVGPYKFVYVNSERADLVWVDPQINRIDHKHLYAWQRIELTHPTPEVSKMRRSVRTLSQFDCASNRQQLLLIEEFSGPNLSGTREGLVPNDSWFAPKSGTLAEGYQVVVCKKGSRSALNQFNLGPYRLLTINRDAAHFVWADPALNRGPAHIINALIRVEFFVPALIRGKVFRSERALEQYDCKMRRDRMRFVDAFSGAGLSGRRSREVVEHPWSVTPRDTRAYVALKLLCATVRA